MNPSSPNADALFPEIVWGAEHDAFEDPVSQSAFQAYAHGVCDDLIAGILMNRVREFRKKEALGSLMPFRIARLNEGELVLGLERYRIPLQWLVEHSLLVGNTGSGKTILLMFLLLQLAANRCNVWVSENYKLQFRHLLPFFRQTGRDLVVLGARDWRWNLLQAPGDPRVHLTTSVDLLCRLPEMPSRARMILRQVAHALYQKFGIWDGQTEAWPTLFDLYEAIRLTRGLNEAAREAILDRLGSLLVVLTPKCVAYRRAWTAVDLAKHSIAFEMRDAPEMVKKLLLESCLFSVFQNEIERGVTQGSVNLVIAFDDAQRFFDDSGGNDLAGMAELAGVIRGSRKGLFILVQTMRGLSKKLIPNLTFKIFGRLGSHEDYEALGAEMGLTAVQRDWCKHNLQPGMFIGQVGTGHWRHPFLFRAPLYKPGKEISEEEARDTLRTLDNIPVVPAAEFENWKPHSVIDLTGSGEKGRGRFSDLELRFLRAVVAKPGKASSFYAKQTGLNGRRAAEIRRHLIQGGLLREHKAAISARGRTALVLEPLQTAFAIAANAKGDTK